MEPLGLPTFTGPLDALMTIAGLPGKFVNGLIGGKPGKQMTGREMLEARGAVGPNTDQGWVPDTGDVAGFGAEMLTDPLNWTGAGALAKTAKTRSAAKATNSKSLKMRAMGAMPGELVEQLHSSLKDESGMPIRVTHGTPRSGIDVKDLDPARAGKNTDFGFLGKGTYFSQTPEHSNHYTRAGWVGLGGEPHPGANIMAHVFAKDPLLFDHVKTPHPRDAMPELMHLTENTIEDSPNLINDVLKKRGHDAVVATGNEPNHFEIMIPNKDQIFAPYVAPKMEMLPSFADPVGLIMSHNAMKERRKRK